MVLFTLIYIAIQMFQKHARQQQLLLSFVFLCFMCSFAGNMAPIRDIMSIDPSEAAKVIAKVVLPFKMAHYR